MKCKFLKNILITCIQSATTLSCLHVCVWYVCTHVPGTHVEISDISGVSPHLSPCLFVICCCPAYPRRLAHYLTGFSISTSHLAVEAEFTLLCQFYMGSEDSNSGPHACTFTSQAISPPPTRYPWAFSNHWAKAGKERAKERAEEEDLEAALVFPQ